MPLFAHIWPQSEALLGKARFLGDSLFLLADAPRKEELVECKDFVGRNTRGPSATTETGIDAKRCKGAVGSEMQQRQCKALVSLIDSII